MKTFNFCALKVFLFFIFISSNFEVYTITLTQINKKAQEWVEKNYIKGSGKNKHYEIKWDNFNFLDKKNGVEWYEDLAYVDFKENMISDVHAFIGFGKECVIAGNPLMLKFFLENNVYHYDSDCDNIDDIMELSSISLMNAIKNDQLSYCTECIKNHHEFFLLIKYFKDNK